MIHLLRGGDPLPQDTVLKKSQAQQIINKILVIFIGIPHGKSQSVELHYPTEEKWQFQKSLGKMLFKNSLRDTLALILCKWHQSSEQCRLFIV